MDTNTKIIHLAPITGPFNDQTLCGLPLWVSFSQGQPYITSKVNDATCANCTEIVGLFGFNPMDKSNLHVDCTCPAEDIGSAHDSYCVGRAMQRGTR